MNNPAPARLVGLFALGALALAVVLALLFGRGNYFSKAHKYVAYFQGSVNGLNVGAPVKLKGVTIGRVTDVLVQYDMAHNRVLTPVIAEIDLGKVTDIRDPRQEPHAPSLQELIDRGLRARLSLHSLVTGQLYMDVNFFPDRPVQRVGAQNPGLPEIPTIPSGKEEIENALQDAATEFRQLPVRETFDTTLRSLRHIEQLLAAPDTQASPRQLNRALQELRQLLGHVDAKVDNLSGNLDGTLKDSRALLGTLNQRVVPVLAATERALTATTHTADQAQDALTALKGFAEPDSELNQALREMSAAARAVRNLADSLERHPEALLQGRREDTER